MRWSDFLYGTPNKFAFQHAEIVGDNVIHFGLGPVFANLGLFLFAFADDREAQTSQNEIGLTWGFTATELLGQEDPSRQVTAGKSDNRLGRIPFAAVNKLITGGRAERMVDAGVQVVEGLDNVLGLQTGWDGLGHG